MNYWRQIFLCIVLISCQNKQEKSTDTGIIIIEDSTDSNVSDLLDVVPDQTLNIKESDNERIKFRIDLNKIDSFKCNGRVVLHVDVNMDSLTKEDIDALLKTFDHSCSSNVEFSEFSNEILFKVLEKYPAETLELIESMGNSYDFKTIYLEVSSPLHDLVPIEQIEKVIRDKNLKGARIDSISKALKIAIGSY